jgi:hypothetical protein
VLLLLHAPSYQSIWEPEAPTYSGRSPSIPSWSTTAALRNLRDALCGAFAALRQYEHLMSRGMRHEVALRQALGISNTAK